MTGAMLSELEARIRGALRHNGVEVDEDTMQECVCLCWERDRANPGNVVWRAAEAMASIQRERARLRDAWAEETFGEARRIKGETGELVTVSVPRCLTMETPETRRRRFVRPFDFATLPSLIGRGEAGGANLDALVDMEMRLLGWTVID